MQNLPVSRLSTTLRALHTIVHRFLLTRNDEAIDICAVKLRVSVIGLASPLGFRKMERVSPHLLRCVSRLTSFATAFRKVSRSSSDVGSSGFGLDLCGA